MEKGKNIKQAFEELISVRGWWKNIGLTEDQGNNYRTRFKAGKLTYEKMSDVLMIAGLKKVQEELWSL